MSVYYIHVAYIIQDISHFFSEGLMGEPTVILIPTEFVYVKEFAREFT